MQKVKARVSAEAKVELVVTIKKWESGEVDLDEVLMVLAVGDVKEIEVIEEI